MIRYPYRCPAHGPVEVVKPMALAARPETCACGLPLTRVFTGQHFIVRPTGWNLSPDDPRYSSRLSFARERELGELRTITSASEDRTIMAEAAAEDWPAPPDTLFDKIDQRGMQQISEWCQANADALD